MEANKNKAHIAAGTSSSVTITNKNFFPQKSAEFMIDDIRLFRDFVLYYNKNRFKKYRYQALND
jgi:hypothetical protein